MAATATPTKAEQAKAAAKAKADAKAREQLVKKIIQLRGQKVPWDGDNGICKQLGLKGAPQGRKLLREFAAGELIAPSYDRDMAKARREAEATKK